MTSGQVAGDDDPGRANDAAAARREFGAALSRIHKERGLTLRELEERTGIKRTALHGWIHEAKIPRNAAQLHELLAVYGVDQPMAMHLMALHAAARFHGAPQVNISGDNYGVIVHSQPQVVDTPSTLAERQQEFFFDFLQESLKQYGMTFRISIGVALAGALVIMGGGVLALVKVGNPDLSYVPVVTALAGVLITTTAGAFAVHANRARVHLTQEVSSLKSSIQADHEMEQSLKLSEHKLSQTVKLIDGVADTDLQNRLRSIAAAWAMGLAPDPIDLSRYLSPKHIDSVREPETDRPCS
ncbi:helix-turn-helix transcriptional regulator [Nocardia sp. NPDC050710]|uniref:helix-turn-helix domain-containing protein n=1 Tax=Nocardia sp. NPDC050710 TaxID=3157220 RepID=UPI003402145E